MKNNLTIGFFAIVFWVITQSNTAPSPKLMDAGIVTLHFNDTLLVNKYNTSLKSNTCLQAESKIKSVTYQDGQTTFNIGIADFEGDGIFNDPKTDLLILTNPQNRHVRINGDNGTPHCAIRDSLYLEVDGMYYLLTNIDRKGASAVISRLKKLPAGKTPAITLTNYVRGIKLEKYTGGQALIDTLYAGKPLLYICFWDTHIVDFQMQQLDSIDKNFKSRVRIVGVHNKEHELDKTSQGNFFKLMAKPWNGYNCTEQQYIRMNQDFSSSRGLLLEPDGKIIYPHISPKELFDWLKM